MGYVGVGGFVDLTCAADICVFAVGFATGAKLEVHKGGQVYRDRFVMHLMTAADASAPADAVFRFTAGETMQTSRPTSASVLACASWVRGCVFVWRRLPYLTRFYGEYCSGDSCTGTCSGQRHRCGFRCPRCVAELLSA